MNAEIARYLPEIEKLCQRYGVAVLELFGSATGPHFNSATSDFDFVATFLDTGPDSDYGGRYLDFCRELERLLRRPIDVVTTRSIRRKSFRESVDSSRQLVYEAKSGRAIA